MNNTEGLGSVALVLHDIRSVINVGAMFRTAEAFGVEKIILSGYTPGPIDRFGRIRQDFHKAALGAEDLVVWEQKETSTEVISQLKTEGRTIVALEQSELSEDIRSLSADFVGEKKIALVLGNEVDGVDRAFLNDSDLILEIPMFGEKESFNVASAAAIALYAILAA